MKKQKQANSPQPFNNDNNVEPSVSENEDPRQDNVKKVIHAPHKYGSKKLRPEHTKDVKSILTNAGYTPEIQDSLVLKGRLTNVFTEIHKGKYSGNMEPVIRLIQSLGGVVDEIRSGSRIGFILRQIKTNEIVGTDMLSPGDEI